MTWSEPDPKYFSVADLSPDLHPEAISDLSDYKICIISANLYLKVVKLVIELVEYRYLTRYGTYIFFKEKLEHV